MNKPNISVEEILDTYARRVVENGYMQDYFNEALEQLYELLVSEAQELVRFDKSEPLNVGYGAAEIQQVHPIKAIPLEAINRLFGRE